MMGLTLAERRAVTKTTAIRYLVAKKRVKGGFSTSCVQTRVGIATMPARRSNRQYLWIEIFYAASSVAVVSSGRSTSLPFSNFAPARTSATRWGALTARQRDWAASISL